MVCILTCTAEEAIKANAVNVTRPPDADNPIIPGATIQMVV
jgi:hypothetical protein